MKFTCIKKARDLNAVLQAGGLLRKLSKSKTGFRKRLLEKLEEKGGQFELWIAFRRLSDLLQDLGQAPCELEVEDGRPREETRV
jgi:hypothetical protein